MPKRRNIGKHAIVAALLLLIVGYGAALRLVGHNWDDFSHIHPDERFLTILLLPQVGRGNNFTEDDPNFPDQQIFALRDSIDVRNRDDFLNLFTIPVGVIKGTSSSDASRWLVRAGRTRSYRDYWEAESALHRREVAALLVDKRQQPLDADVVLSVDTFTSKELQDLRCKRLYPVTNGIGDYFDTRCSPLNPHNAGHSFYVYGTFPLFLAHFGSDIVRHLTDAGLPFFDYQGGHLVWRGISTIFDVLTIMMVFALGRRTHNSWVGLLAALFYAAAPLAIQKAHFGTVNAVTSFFVTLALYYAIGAQQRGRLGSYFMFGIACGTAVASRINVAPLAFAIVLAAVFQSMPAFDPRLSRQERLQIVFRHLLVLVVAGFGAFLAFRIFNPYAFAGPGFFGILPNDRWVENLQRISAGVSSLQDFPPNWHWVARSPLVHISKDMLFWGMGIGFGVLALFGWCWATYRLLRNRKKSTDVLILIIWISGYLLWMSRLTALTIRYYLPLYGSLAILAGWCLWELYHYAKANGRSLSITAIPLIMTGALLSAIGCHQIATGRSDATAITALVGGLFLLVCALVPRFSRRRPLVLGIFAVIFSVAWGAMFANIYRHQTTLVRASRYIFERIPGDFALRIDGTDDSVPLINIAVSNTGVATDNLSGPPYDRATHYDEGRPTRIEFEAPASGTVSHVFAPHLGDPHDDPQPEEVLFRIYGNEGESPVSEAVLRTNLSRDRHPLGSAYTVKLNPPLEVVEGLSYSFVVEVLPGSGDVIGSGSVVLNEGAWDNSATGINTCRLPDGLTLADDPPPGLVADRYCHGTQAFYTLINSVDQIMSFPVDNQFKYDDIVRSLDIGDYLTIASNRFYDTEPRNLLRWPLTTLYYEKLFAEELGYEIAAVFEETFELGPWRVSDQHLPTYDSPIWLNELEADESFHVYDHPAVYVFKKTEDYAREKVEAIFSAVSLKQARELQNTEEEAQLLGVFNWSATQADGVPTALMLPPADYAVQTEGGTWSERFFSDVIVNTNQAVGVLAWYITMFVFGAMAFPLVNALFPNMSDGGYGVSKLVGLLLVAWFAWSVSSLKIPIWSQSGVLFSLALLALLSATIGRARFIPYLRENWRRLAWMELLAFAAFLFMIAVRLTNPDLWHPGKGGEKPMDFAFLNGVLRSTTFPPIDPWFSGGFINYYYFGYVLLGAPALLLGVVPAFAYNLMIPTVFSLTGMGTFSAAFNILARWRKTDDKNQPGRRLKRRLGKPWVAGIMALILCVLLGNLDTVRVFGNGLAQLGGYRTPTGLENFLVVESLVGPEAILSPEDRAAISRRASESHPLDNLRYEVDNSLSLVLGLLRGTGQALGGQPLPIGSDRWYWGPSRVITETHGVGGGAITEMPYFTFLYGDLHAHMISMPLILLTVICLFNELVQAGRDQRRLSERSLALALLALAVGVLQATNTWDWPSMTLFALVTLAYAWGLRWHKTFRPIDDSRFYLGTVAALIVAAAIVSLVTPPADSGFGDGSTVWLIFSAVVRVILLAGVGAVLLLLSIRYLFVRASALDLAAKIGGFMILNLAFALPYTSWYAATYNSVRLWDGGKTPLWAYIDIHGLFLFLIVSLLLWDTGHWLRATRVKSLLENRRILKSTAGLVAITCLLAIVLTLAAYQVALIVLPLVCWIALLFFRPGQSRAMRFTLVLIGLALSMTLGVEIIVIGGDIGRQNTVFKFYMQVWLLLSVAGGVAFACLVQASERFSSPLRYLWYTPCILLIAIAALFPLMGTRARSFDRMAPDLPLTLNGMDYMTRSTHVEFSSETGDATEIDLAVDHELIRWMQENVSGSPVIMEGRRRPSEYHWNGRFAITTGLPSVLGWNFHQRQQRTFHPMGPWVDQREKNIMQFYRTPSIDIAVDIIHHFDVKYIIQSGLEAAHATEEGLAKFELMVDHGLLSISYEIDGGRIYQVNDEALLSYKVERHS